MSYFVFPSLVCKCRLQQFYLYVRTQITREWCDADTKYINVNTCTCTVCILEKAKFQ